MEEKEREEEEKEEEGEEIGLLYISRSISAGVPYLGSSNRIHIYARPSPVHRDSVNKLYISNGPETDLLASRTSKGSFLASCSVLPSIDGAPRQGPRIEFKEPALTLTDNGARGD